MISYLPNIPILEDQLNKELYNSLYKECIDCGNNAKALNPLTGAGLPGQYYIEDKNNLKNLEQFIFKLIKEYKQSSDLIDYAQVLTKDVPYVFGKPWINIQKKYEFIPSHHHEGIISYVIWIKIPYELEVELEVGRNASIFQFNYNSILGYTLQRDIKLDKKDEGRILMFPSKLNHQVYPFYKCDDTRISIAGNILLKG
jgi:hypothetical protein